MAQCHSVNGADKEIAGDTPAMIKLMKSCRLRFGKTNVPPGGIAVLLNGHSNAFGTIATRPECCDDRAGSFALAIERIANTRVRLANPVDFNCYQPDPNGYAPGSFVIAPGLFGSGQERVVCAPCLAASAMQLFGE